MYLEDLNDSRSRLVIVHLLLGYILWLYPFLSTYLGFGIFLFGIYRILFSANYNDKIPLYFSAYIVGLEVFLRMTEANLFWEFGKYALISFLILGSIRQSKGIKIYFPILIYFILLVPSIINLPIISLNAWRQDVSFNLSGPLCILMSSIYLYNFSFKKNELEKLFFYSLLPVYSMSVVILLKMPSFTLYNFSPFSNPLTSGGFGPNQVSSILGYAIAILFIARIVNVDLFRLKIVNYFSFILFFGLGLITFSRGGVLSSLLAILLTTCYSLFRDQSKIKMILSTLILIAGFIGIWTIMIDVTSGIIMERYAISGDNASDGMFVDLSGRAEIFIIDFKIFLDNIISGVGPGQAFYARELYGYGSQVAAHIEFTRLLAEHGMLGLFALLILLNEPLRRFISLKNIDNKKIIIIFSSLALFTMFHSALRIVMPCFAFSLIYLTLEE